MTMRAVAEAFPTLKEDEHTIARLIQFQKRRAVRLERMRASAIAEEDTIDDQYSDQFSDSTV